MGWGNSFFPLLIVTSSTGFTGLFVYSPGPGTGNLIASIASHNGTDPYGNAFRAGVTTYFNAGATFFAINLDGNDILFMHAASAGGPYAGDQTFVSSGPAAVPPLGTQALQLSGNFVVTGNIAVSTAGFNMYAPGFVALNPSGTIETWHAASLAAGFTAGGTTPRYQYEAINGGRVVLEGAVNLTANEPFGTAMFTLPVGYRPARSTQFVTTNSLSGYALGGSSVQILTSGAVTITPAGSTGNFVVLDGIRFALD